MTAATNVSVHHRPSNYDETSMQESLLFSDSLKDLKNLRTQLYNAAEYFELSYTNHDQQELVLDTLKEYTIKALVNTIDHLGSVTFKLNDLIDEKIEDVSGSELRLSCIQQRLSTCQEYIDREGMAQQSLIVDAPKYHKRYVMPASQTMDSSNLANLKYKGNGVDDDDWLQSQSAVKATIRGTPSKIGETPSTIKEAPSFARRRHSISPYRASRSPGSFSFTGSIPKEDVQPVSPRRFPLLRSGSLASRPTSLKSSMPTSTNPAPERQRYISDSLKSASMRVHDEKEKPKDIERHPSKSKSLLKTLLSRRKSKKDDMLFTYLDEY